jgi:hypothetical protein
LASADGRVHAITGTFDGGFRFRLAGKLGVSRNLISARTKAKNPHWGKFRMIE